MPKAAMPKRICDICSDKDDCDFDIDTRSCSHSQYIQEQKQIYGRPIGKGFKCPICSDGVLCPIEIWNEGDKAGVHKFDFECDDCHAGTKVMCSMKIIEADYGTLVTQELTKTKAEEYGLTDEDLLKNKE